MLFAVGIRLKSAFLPVMGNSSPLLDTALGRGKFRVHIEAALCLSRKVCCTLFILYKYYLKNREKSRRVIYHVLFMYPSVPPPEIGMEKAPPERCFHIINIHET